MINENILVYSTVAGELPNMVKNHKPFCFVAWNDYAQLKKYACELENKLNELENNNWNGRLITMKKQPIGL